LLKLTNGTILHQGGMPVENDLFIPPTILDVEVDDPIMKTEVPE
jgi:hypothetical protein